MTLITRSTQQDGTILVQFNGTIHNPHGPAVIKANGTREWAKDGMLHSWHGQPSQIFANGTKRWHHEGRLTSQYRLNADGKGRLLTQYHTNGHRASEYSEDQGIRLDYSFENGLLISKTINSAGVKFCIFEGRLMQISSTTSDYTYKVPGHPKFNAKVEQKLLEMIAKCGIPATCNIISDVDRRFQEQRQRENALAMLSIFALSKIFG